MSAVQKAKCVLEGEVKGVLTFEGVSELATGVCTSLLCYVGLVVQSSTFVQEADLALLCKLPHACI